VRKNGDGSIGVSFKKPKAREPGWVGDPLAHHTRYAPGKSAELLPVHSLPSQHDVEWDHIHNTFYRSGMWGGKGVFRRLFGLLAYWGDYLGYEGDVFQDVRDRIT
jgi:hypothetical protein